MLICQTAEGVHGQRKVGNHCLRCLLELSANFKNWINVFLLWFGTYLLEIDRYGFFEADTDTSKSFKSCLLLHYQKYDVFYVLPFFETLKIRIYKQEFLKLQQFRYILD